MKLNSSSMFAKHFYHSLWNEKVENNYTAFIDFKELESIYEMNTEIFLPEIEFSLKQI